MKYRVKHLTEYQYNSAVSLCYNMTHLMPRHTENQRCLSRQIRVSPHPVYEHHGKDYFGNHTYYFSIQEPHEKLSIEVESFFDIQPKRIPTEHYLTCAAWQQQLAEARTPEIRMVKEFMLDSELIHRSEKLASFAADLFTPDQSFLEATLLLMQRVFEDFTFDPVATSVSSPPEQVLEEKRGVCQDFAHLAIAVIRSLGFPARYMSGYIETLPPPGQEKMVGADASHAWFAVFIPELGWVEFDPTNNLMPNDQHIVTAYGRDYLDVTPLQGVIFDGGETLGLVVSVDVHRIA